MNKDFFNDLKKDVLEIKDRHPHLSLDNAFVAWFLRAFVTVTEDDAVSSIKGGAKDKSTDGVYIDNTARLVFIIQGKYHQQSEPLTGRSDVLALADLGRAMMLEKKETFDLLIKKANSSVSHALTEARNVIHKKGFGLVVQFVTTGKISSTHLEEAEQRLDDWDNCRYDAYTKADLLKLMQDYLEGAAPPTPTITIPVSGTEVFNRYDKTIGVSSWIFSASGKQVGDIFNDIGIRLFARNIRGYLGNTEINKVMRKTIEDEPEYFWYYNNGITITCDRVKQINKGTSNVVQITNAQIINGQQTTRTLAQVRDNDAEVLIKLIEISRKTDQDHKKFGHVVSSIVSATNWQNAISQADLKSNDPEQVRIEKEMKKLNYFYIRKRMNKSEVAKYGGDRYSFKINKEELARTMAAIKVDPYEIRLGKDRLFEDDIYSEIFDGRSAAEYLTAYWLGRNMNYWVKTNNRYSYSKWIVLNQIWFIVGSDLKKVAARESFRKISERPNKYAKELKPLDEIVKLTLKMSLKFYSDNKKMDGKLQEPIDFFKHVKYHLFFRQYIKQKHKGYLAKVENLKRKFLGNLEEVEY
ncbi:MAG: AIPR family protein [Cyclobacteriaceae bacterium]